MWTKYATKCAAGCSCTNIISSANRSSDIWGWVDSQGNEYALLAQMKGHLFSLTNPSQPVEVFFEQGMNSIWRDIKTFGNYAYKPGSAYGLLIIDMFNYLPTPT